MPQLILTLLLIAIGWFLLIRPQQARLRQQRAMVESLQVGDHVVTAGGIHGVLRAISEETVRVEVSPGVEITVARPAIMRRLDADAAPGATGTDGDTAGTAPDVAPSDEPTEDV